MCTILFAYDNHPRYQLVVVSNRDEFYQRSALPAAFWPDHPNILAGKDLKEGGTWMGVTTGGRFAALTNYRDPASYKNNAPSRGYMVQDYLSSDLEPDAYIARLPDEGLTYNGFNFLAGMLNSLYYYSNREKILRKIEKGIHGLSNGLLDDPWPKVSQGKKLLGECLQQDKIAVADLFHIMTNRDQPADQELPSTGVSLEMERMLAPIFVTSTNYGTKSSTVILVDRNQEFKYCERTYVPGQPEKWQEVAYQFKIQ